MVPAVNTQKATDLHRGFPHRCKWQAPVNQFDSHQAPTMAPQKISGPTSSLATKTHQPNWLESDNWYVNQLTQAPESHMDEWARRAEAR